MTEIAAAVRGRRGRPLLRDGGPKRASFNTRLSDGLKQRLEEIAHAAGRSLSEEIEHRLERSVYDEDLLGGPTIAALIRVLAALAIFEVGPDCDWLSDYEAFNAVTDRWQRLFAEISPMPSNKVRRQIDRWRAAAKRIADDEDLPSDHRDRLIRAVEYATRNTLLPQALRQDLALAAAAARDKWGLR